MANEEPAEEESTEVDTVELDSECLLDAVWITLEEVSLLEMLRRVEGGEDADMVYAEFFANTAVSSITCDCEEDCEGVDCECDLCFANQDDDDEDEDGEAVA